MGTGVVPELPAEQRACCGLCIRVCPCVRTRQASNRREHVSTFIRYFLRSVSHLNKQQRPVMFRLCAPLWTPSENICVFPSRCRTPRCTQPAAGPSREGWLVSGIQVVLFRDVFPQTSPAFSPWQPGSRAATEAGGLGGSRGMLWRGEAHDGACALQSFGMRECPNSTPDPSPAHSLGSSGLSFLICEMGAKGAQPSLCDSEG